MEESAAGENLLHVAPYEIGLIIAGLVACLVAVRLLPRQARLGFPGTTPWELKTPDFVLFVCLFFIWYIAASSFSLNLATKMRGDKGEEPILAAAIGNAILHFGLILLFWRWRETHRTPTEKRLNRALMEMPKALGVGGFYFLISIILVYGVGLLWQLLLLLGQQQGLDINLAPQAAVELFKQADDPLGFAALAVVAVILAPISEELVFRAGLYRFFSGRMGKLSAMIFSGLLFGFIHGNLVGFAPLAALGILLCVVYEITGNLRVPIVVHGLFNLNTLVLLLLSPDLPA